jgi:phosphoribosylanthranilate isomerase
MKVTSSRYRDACDAIGVTAKIDVQVSSATCSFRGTLEGVFQNAEEPTTEVMIASQIMTVAQLHSIEEDIQNLKRRESRKRGMSIADLI